MNTEDMHFVSSRNDKLDDKLNKFIDEHMDEFSDDLIKGIKDGLKKNNVPLHLIYPNMDNEE